MGDERTAPARDPILSRRENASNGMVAMSRHSPSRVKAARLSAGSEQ